MFTEGKVEADIERSDENFVFEIVLFIIVPGVLGCLEFHMDGSLLCIEGVILNILFDFLLLQVPVNHCPLHGLFHILDGQGPAFCNFLIQTFVHV